MKKILLFSLIILAAPLITWTQCMQSRISSSDIRLPDAIASGKKAQVTLTAYNIGDCDWINSEVALRVTVARGPSGSSVQRDELTTGDDIKMDRTEVDSKSGYGKFIFNIEGPDYAGDYVLQFQLVHKGKPFGARVQLEIEVFKNQADCKLASAIAPGNVKMPDKILAGKKVPVNILAENRGNCDWLSARNKIELRVKCLSWPSGADAAEINKIRPREELVSEETDEIAPGKSASFLYNLTGPNVPGIYTLEFQMVNEGTAFGPKCQKKIEVLGDPKKCDVDASIQVSGVPSTMVYNQEYSLVIRMQNMGLCDWSPASKIELVAKVESKPSGSPSQLPGLVPGGGEYSTGSNVIEPGKYFEVRYKVKGPYLPGSYELSWEIYKEGRPTAIKIEKSFKVVAPK